MPESLPPPASPPRAKSDRFDRVGASLRKVFDDAAAEPLPDAFNELLRQLR